MERIFLAAAALAISGAAALTPANARVWACRLVPLALVSAPVLIGMTVTTIGDGVVILTGTRVNAA